MAEETPLRLTTGRGLVGTGRFLLGSKKDASDRVAGEEWRTMLFVPVAPLRSLRLKTRRSREDGVPAVVEEASPLSVSQVGNGYASSLPGLVAVVLTLRLVYVSSSNTGLLGGLAVVAGSGLLMALAGYLDWRRPRVEGPSEVDL